MDQKALANVSFSVVCGDCNAEVSAGELISGEAYP